MHAILIVLLAIAAVLFYREHLRVVRSGSLTMVGLLVALTAATGIVAMELAVVAMALSGGVIFAGAVKIAFILCTLVEIYILLADANRWPLPSVR